MVIIMVIIAILLISMIDDDNFLGIGDVCFFGSGIVSVHGGDGLAVAP